MASSSGSLIQNRICCSDQHNIEIALIYQHNQNIEIDVSLSSEQSVLFGSPMPAIMMDRHEVFDLESKGLLTSYGFDIKTAFCCESHNNLN